MLIRWFSIFKDTVLQPAIKKKKSVSKLEVKDVTNSEKYILQHQEQDSQGEVETQLYKVWFSMFFSFFIISAFWFYVDGALM